uniref:Uncharacterized protein n=1 Tax=Timspurckia oligopyrenoides TaxID=708627 RepID=A0A7S0ZAR8_9RHOD
MVDAKVISESAYAARSLYREYMRYAEAFPIPSVRMRLKLNVKEGFQFRAWQARAVSTMQDRDTAERVFTNWRNEATESLKTFKTLLDLPLDTLKLIFFHNRHGPKISRVPQNLGWNIGPP